MTVPSQENSITHLTDGVSTVFPVPYYFLAAEHLSVVLFDPATGVAQDLVLGADYTVLGAGLPAGGSVTTVVAQPTGLELHIRRDRVPYTQETAYQRNDPFPERAHERALDKLTMLVQQIGRLLGILPGTLSRALMLGPYDPPSNGGSYRARNNRIQDLANPARPQDAVNLRTMLAADAAITDEFRQEDASIRAEFRAADASIINEFRAADADIRAEFRGADNGLWAALSDIRSPDGTLRPGIVTPVSLNDYLRGILVPGVRVATDYVTPFDFGARGDGDHDDSDALEEMFFSGLPVYWGGGANRFVATRQLTINPVGAMWWAGAGATLEFWPPEAIFRGIFIDGMRPGINRLGGLFILGNDLVQQGLRINGAAGVSGSLVVDDLHVRNVRRASTQFNEGGSGIDYRGGHEQVTYRNCSVKHLRLSPGAGIPGISGVQGMMVRPGNGGRPKLITAEACLLEDIRVDDLGEQADHDGMLFWVDRSTSPDSPHETHVEARGNFFKNCIGRAIKAQCESTNVTGVRVIRDVGQTIPGLGVDVDLQVGGGRVSGFSAVYNGPNSAPFRAIILSTTDEVTKPQPIGHVDGVEISMVNGGSMESVVQTSQRVAIRSTYRIKNVSVYGGTIETIVRLAGNNVGSRVNLSLESVTAAPTLSFVKATNGPSTGSVFLDDLINLSDTPVWGFARNATGMNMRVSVGQSEGLRDAKYPGMLPDVPGIAAFGDISRINSYCAADDVVGGGRTRLTTFQLGPNETRELPSTFRATPNNAGQFKVSIARNRQDNAMFICDNTGVEKMWGGTSMHAGGTTMPETGTFRFWTGPNGLPMVGNFDASARIFTVEMFG